MSNSNIKPELHNKFFHKISIKLVLIVIVSGFLGISSFDLTYNNVTAQTLQGKCTPDMGINISKSILGEDHLVARRGVQERRDLVPRLLEGG